MTKRFRVKYMFWLDINKDSEYELAEIIEDLKYHRGFSSAIRDGLRIIWELRRGDTTTLYKLFPTLSTGQGDNAELARLLAEFKNHMTRDEPPRLFDLPASSEPPKVSAIFDESAAKQRTIQATLSSLDDF